MRSIGSYVVKILRWEDDEVESMVRTETREVVAGGLCRKIFKTTVVGHTDIALSQPEHVNYDLQ